MAAFGRVAQPGTRPASPTDAPDSVRPSRKAVPFPAINVTARRVAVRAKQEEGPPAAAWQHAQNDTENRGTTIGSLQFHMVIFSVRIVRINIARQPDSFLDLAVVSLVLPDQQVPFRRSKVFVFFVALQFMQCNLLPDSAYFARHSRKKIRASDLLHRPQILRDAYFSMPKMS